MFVGRDFSFMDVGENEVFSLDFVNDLPSMDSISSVVWTISVTEGTDPSPSSHLDGSPGFTGTVAMQRISGLLPNVNYLLKATVETALGNTMSLWSHVRCVTPA